MGFLFREIARLVAGKLIQRLGSGGPNAVFSG